MSDNRVPTIHQPLWIIIIFVFQVSEAPLLSLFYILGNGSQESFSNELRVLRTSVNVSIVFGVQCGVHTKTSIHFVFCLPSDVLLHKALLFQRKQMVFI